MLSPMSRQGEYSPGLILALKIAEALDTEICQLFPSNPSRKELIHDKPGQQILLDAGRLS